MLFLRSRTGQLLIIYGMLFLSVYSFRAYSRDFSARPSIFRSTIKWRDSSNVGNRVDLAPLYSQISGTILPKESVTKKYTLPSMNCSLSSESVQSLKINALVLLFYASMGSAMPYLPIFYKNIGLKATEIGFLGAITPAITFLVSPLWGMLADSSNRHKEILFLAFFGSVLSRCLLAVQCPRMPWLSIIVALSAFFHAPVKPILDSLILSSLADKSLYGQNRLFGQIGFGLGSYASGQFLAQNGRMTPMFLLHALFSLGAGALMVGIPSFRVVSENSTTPHHASFNVSSKAADHHIATTISTSINSLLNLDSWNSLIRSSVGLFSSNKMVDSSLSPELLSSTTVMKPPLQNKDYFSNNTITSTTTVSSMSQVYENMIQMIKQSHSVTRHYFSYKLLAFFSVIFAIGLSSGVIENFAYVRVSELAGPESSQSLSILGWSRLWCSLAGGPVFWYAGKLYRTFSMPAILTLTMLIYSFRFVLYAKLITPWQILPAEILRGMSFALFWSASTSYVYQNSPPGLSATMLSLLNGIFGGLGQSSGSLIGGWMSRSMGITSTFLWWAGFDLGLVALYWFYQLALQPMLMTLKPSQKDASSSFSSLLSTVVDSQNSTSRLPF